MNSHFKKNRKGNTGKIGVWDKIKIKNENVRKFKKKLKALGDSSGGWLTCVKDVLRIMKRRSFYPLISSLGVKIVVNIVNIRKTPLNFQSRREITSIIRGIMTSSVNNKKTLRRGLGSQC